MTAAPPDQQCTLSRCDQEAVDPEEPGSLCEVHIAALEGDSSGENPGFDGDGTGSGGAIGGEWAPRSPATPGRRTYPRPQYELEYWMGAGGAGGKQPFAIWGDRDASAECNKGGHTTAAECDCDARWKWGYEEHYRDGATAERALDDPSVDALTYILHEEEPTLMADGDNVVDPETGEVHPRFLAILDRFGLTYADISQSGSGMHPLYLGELPGGVTQATWWLDDEPWGANDEPPSIEIYDHGRVCVMTGKHVSGTPTEAREIDADALEAVLDENDQLPTGTPDEESEFDSDAADDLTKAEVEEALGHVDEQLHYDDWFRVGLAVYDWDTGSTGKRVFEDWSKDNVKWDEAEGQPHIDDIWNNDSATGKVSVGTLIHHAKAGGWIPPWHQDSQAAAVDLDDAADDVGFHGPPEPITPTDGDPAIVHPNDDNTGLVTSSLTTLECQRCGAYTDGSLANGELQPPYECEHCERQGPFKHPALEEYPSLSLNALVDPQWRAPSDVDGSREGYDELWTDVRDWIHENWVADDDHLYDGLTAYAIATWLRPNFNFLPHIMVMGKHETGKTRLLNTLAYVSYRGRVPVSFTPAAMFRTIDAYNVTLFLSEYHDLNQDLKDEVNAVIKGSQKRGEDVMRISKGPDGQYEPANFDIFTHMGIGTQFDPPDDIISRCIQIQTKPADRDVPVWFDEDAATELRNRLTYARFRLLEGEDDDEPGAWTQAEQRALEWINERGITGRLREKLLCLVTVASLWEQLDAIEPFVDWLEAESEEATADSDDAIMIQAIRDEAIQRVAERAANTHFGGDDASPWPHTAVPYTPVKERFNEMTGRDVNSGYVGQIRKRVGLEKARHSDGTVIKDEDLKPKLQQLCEENNLDWEVTEAHEPVTELDDEEKGKWDCSECGERRATHDHADGGKLCDPCADHARSE